MGSLNHPQVITYDYAYAPNAQKARNLLHAAEIPYLCCDQPFFQPRPIIQDLGITYRRIPVNAIGKDFYCDNRAFTEAIQTIFKDKALPESPNDHAFESFGYRSFWICIALVPSHMNGKELQEDRRDLFAVFNHPDYENLRPSALAEMRQFLDFVENDFLTDDHTFLNNGDRIGVADVHAMWMLKWALETEALGIGYGKQKGFDKSDFPRVYKWIESVPPHDEAHAPKNIEAKDAFDLVMSQDYAAKDIGVDENDPTGFKHGDEVKIATTDDAKPNNQFQHGKLVGLNKREIVIQLPNTIRLHFPRVGYLMKKA